MGNWHTCPAENTNTTLPGANDPFHGETWDIFRIGWMIAFAGMVLTVLITCFHVSMHLINYRRPLEQRQIVRILGMPLVYGVVSFFGYRYFRKYTYFSIAETIYEALTIAAFTLLLILYVGQSREGGVADALSHKEKRKLVFPLNHWRFRPSKPYFLFALKWSVLQYSFLRPIISLIGIICEAYGVLCPTMYSPFFAEIYLDAVDFISISVALYGLILFYVVTKDDLKGKNPLSKFLAIKGIIIVAFYQGLLFEFLEDFNVIKPTANLTKTNISDGLNACLICVEMVIFSVWMCFAFSWSEYSTLPDAQGMTNPFWAFFHSQNYWDFFHEFLLIFSFYRAYRHGTAGTHGEKQPDGKTRPISAFDLHAAMNGHGTAAPSTAVPSNDRNDPEKGFGPYTPIDADASGWVPAPEGEGEMEDPLRGRMPRTPWSPPPGVPRSDDADMETVPITPVGPARASRMGRGWDEPLRREGSVESHAPRPVAGSDSWQDRMGRAEAYQSDDRR